eukprot:UN10373
MCWWLLISNQSNNTKMILNGIIFVYKTFILAHLVTYQNLYYIDGLACCVVDAYRLFLLHHCCHNISSSHYFVIILSLFFFYLYHYVIACFQLYNKSNIRF